VGKSRECQSGYHKTQDHNIGSRQKENRGGTAGTLGKDKGAAEEESCLATLDKNGFATTTANSRAMSPYSITSVPTSNPRSP
jgi:hypothetical protein